jgi:cytochrome c oxidase cbb3-type subunit 4
MISGVITALLLLAFLGIALWAWSARAKPRFDDASRLPLDDEDSPPPDSRTRGQA